MEKKKVTFESALARLEKIVHELEGGEAPLDKSLSLYEEGVGLIKLCAERLDEAEQKIYILSKNEDGSYEKKPFGENN